MTPRLEMVSLYDIHSQKAIGATQSVNGGASVILRNQYYPRLHMNSSLQSAAQALPDQPSFTKNRGASYTYQ